MKKQVIRLDIYTDGSCSIKNNSGIGKGGWAFAVTNGTTGELIKSVSGGEPKTTNNRMELLSIVSALQYVNDMMLQYPEYEYRIRLFSDSAYVVNGINQRWLKKWIMNGWETSNGTPVKNKELWLEINKYDKLFDFQVVKVKGHSGDYYNEYVDKLAKKGGRKVRYDLLECETVVLEE